MSGYTIGEIVVWLVLAAVLGGILGWLLRTLKCRAEHQTGTRSAAKAAPTPPSSAQSNDKGRSSTAVKVGTPAADKIDKAGAAEEAGTSAKADTSASGSPESHRHSDPVPATSSARPVGLVDTEIDGASADSAGRVSQGTAEPGDNSTAVAGDNSTAEPGDNSTAEPGDNSTAEPGANSTAEPGANSTAVAGANSTAESGEPGDKDTAAAEGSADSEATEFEPDVHPNSAKPLAGGAAPGPEWVIKGNADSMIYHTPESRSYGATVAETWFRTAEDARAAGFRPPKR